MWPEETQRAGARRLSEAEKANRRTARAELEPAPKAPRISNRRKRVHILGNGLSAGNPSGKDHAKPSDIHVIILTVILTMELPELCVAMQSACREVLVESGGERGIRTPDYNAEETPMTRSCKSTTCDTDDMENA
ncbi:MAG: hypothetical protein E6R03_03650 [Hyphomicrobiaceae bacterium]|nr:MAG: hypothetical protein E6R03_03650 [Hyphomicrobiaceae bacterium]